MAALISANIHIAQNNDLYVLDCANCGVVFGITEDDEQRRRQDGSSFHCPNGHRQSWHETEVDRLKRELEEARKATAWARESTARARGEAERAQNSLRTTKGHLTRLKARAQAGVCIHCHRTFQNVQRHMASKHEAVS
jgi:hypothetical protein